MLKIDNVSFAYNSQRKLIKELLLNVDKNTVLGIFGPSGSGKTTLLHTIGGLLKPKLGTIVYDNQDLYSIKFGELVAYRKNIVGYSFQNFYLLDGFSVNDNLNLPFMVGKVLAEADDQWKDHLIETLKMQALLDKDIDILSGGEKERVSFIKSLIHKPKILISDEPGNYLNKNLRYKVYDIIKDYSTKSNNICIFTSHDENTIDYFGFDKNITNQDLTIYWKDKNDI